MEILYSVPDRIQLKFTVMESSLSDLYTVEFRQYGRDFQYVKQFMHEYFECKQVIKANKKWFRINNVLLYYQPFDHSFICEMNPLRYVAEMWNRDGYYMMQSGLDFNSNFIDTRFLNGIPKENIELSVYQALEQCKYDSFRIITNFLHKGFNIDTAQLQFECKFFMFEFACDIGVNVESRLFFA
jgi:hypothetical protein